MLSRKTRSIQNESVAFASRTLTEKEKNYPQIEEELFAIVFGAEHFHQSIHGQSMIVHSDHPPLESILKTPLYISLSQTSTEDVEITKIH